MTSLEPYAFDGRIQYPFVIVKQEHPYYIDIVEQLISANLPHFKKCVMITNQWETWSRIFDGFGWDIQLVSCAEAGIVHEIWEHQRTILNDFIVKSQNPYISCFTREIDMLTIIDGPQYLLQNMPIENRFFKSSLLWIAPTSTEIRAQYSVNAEAILGEDFEFPLTNNKQE